MDSYQIVFLIDGGLVNEFTDISAAVTSVSSVILKCLTFFTHKHDTGSTLQIEERQSKVEWGFKFFNSLTDGNNILTRTKSFDASIAGFREFNLKKLEDFEAVLLKTFQAAADEDSKRNDCDNSSETRLMDSLKRSFQRLLLDFSWDRPEILSPVKSSLRLYKNASSAPACRRNNYTFIVSSCDEKNVTLDVKRFIAPHVMSEFIDVLQLKLYWIHFPRTTCSSDDKLCHNTLNSLLEQFSGCVIPAATVLQGSDTHRIEILSEKPISSITEMSENELRPSRRIVKVDRIPNSAVFLHYDKNRHMNLSDRSDTFNCTLLAIKDNQERSCNVELQCLRSAECTDAQISDGIIRTLKCRAVLKAGAIPVCRLQPDLSYLIKPEHHGSMSCSNDWSLEHILTYLSPHGATLLVEIIYDSSVSCLTLGLIQTLTSHLATLTLCRTMTSEDLDKLLRQRLDTSDLIGGKIEEDTKSCKVQTEFSSSVLESWFVPECNGLAIDSLISDINSQSKLDSQYDERFVLKQMRKDARLCVNQSHGLTASSSQGCGLTVKGHGLAASSRLMLYPHVGSTPVIQSSQSSTDENRINESKTSGASVKTSKSTKSLKEEKSERSEVRKAARMAADENKSACVRKKSPRKLSRESPAKKRSKSQSGVSSVSFKSSSSVVASRSAAASRVARIVLMSRRLTADRELEQSVSADNNNMSVCQDVKSAVNEISTVSSSFWQGWSTEEELLNHLCEAYVKVTEGEGTAVTASKMFLHNILTFFKSSEADAATFITKHLLVPSKQIRDKYLSKDGSESQCQKLREFEIQILLRMELDRLRGGSLQEDDDDESLNEIVSMLRGILFLKGSAALTTFLSDTHLSLYSENSGRLLAHIYDELGQCVPVSLQSFLSPNKDEDNSVAPPSSSILANSCSIGIYASSAGSTSSREGGRSKASYRLGGGLERKQIRQIQVPIQASNQRRSVRIASATKVKDPKRQVTFDSSTTTVKRSLFDGSEESRTDKRLSLPLPREHDVMPRRHSTSMSVSSAALLATTPSKCRQLSSSQALSTPTAKGRRVLKTRHVTETPARKQGGGVALRRIKQMRKQMKVTECETETVEESPEKSLQQPRQTQYSQTQSCLTQAYQNQAYLTQSNLTQSYETQFNNSQADPPQSSQMQLSQSQLSQSHPRLGSLARQRSFYSSHDNSAAQSRSVTRYEKLEQRLITRHTETINSAATTTLENPENNQRESFQSTPVRRINARALVNFKFSPSPLSAGKNVRGLISQVPGQVSGSAVDRRMCTDSIAALCSAGDDEIVIRRIIPSTSVENRDLKKSDRLEEMVGLRGDEPHIIEGVEPLLGSPSTNTRLQSRLSTANPAKKRLLMSPVRSKSGLLGRKENCEVLSDRFGDRNIQKTSKKSNNRMEWGENGTEMAPLKSFVFSISGSQKDDLASDVIGLLDDKPVTKPSSRLGSREARISSGYMTGGEPSNLSPSSLLCSPVKELEQAGLDEATQFASPSHTRSDLRLTASSRSFRSRTISQMSRTVTQSFTFGSLEMPVLKSPVKLQDNHNSSPGLPCLEKFAMIQNFSPIKTRENSELPLPHILPTFSGVTALVTNSPRKFNESPNVMKSPPCKKMLPLVSPRSTRSSPGGVKLDITPGHPAKITGYSPALSNSSLKQLLESPLLGDVEKSSVRKNERKRNLQTQFEDAN